MYKTFGSTIKFNFLAQFPVDYLPHASIFPHLLILCYVAEFAYHVINC